MHCMHYNMQNQTSNIWLRVGAVQSGKEWVVIESACANGSQPITLLTLASIPSYCNRPVYCDLWLALWSAGWHDDATMQLLSSQPVSGLVYIKPLMCMALHRWPNKLVGCFICCMYHAYQGSQNSAVMRICLLSEMPDVNWNVKTNKYAPSGRDVRVILYAMACECSSCVLFAHKHVPPNGVRYLS